MRIMSAQLNTTVGDLAGNTQKIISCLNQANEYGVDLVCFPELTITGYPPEDLVLKKSLVNDNLDYFNRIISYTAKLTRTGIIFLGYVSRGEKNRIYNSVGIITQGKCLGHYHKMNLPNYSVFDEKRYFVPGDRIIQIEYQGKYITPLICEDIWVKNKFQILFPEHTDLVMVLNASPYHIKKQVLREKLVTELARDYGVKIVYVNLVGGQDELVFDGGSFAVNRQGHLVNRSLQFDVDVRIYELNLTHPPVRKKPNRRMKYFMDTVEKIKVIVPQSINLSLSSIPQIRPVIGSLYGKEEEIYRALVLATRDYVQKNRFKKVALGLSGGIDSALTAVIAVDAVGKENVVCVAMPSEYNLPVSLVDARKLTRNLGVDFKVVAIKEIHHVYRRILTWLKVSDKTSLAEENIQARIRGNILMSLSNRYGWLILTTGNKSEISVGYATLYGDMAGGFNVLKDVFKTTVYKLAQFRNSISRTNLIPKRIITRAPSAELRPNQKDTDSLPDYAILDKILKMYVEQDKSINEIIRQGFTRTIVEDIARKVDLNEYKRRQSAPGVRISTKAFGKDRRMPITNLYRNGDQPLHNP